MGRVFFVLYLVRLLTEESVEVVLFFRLGVVMDAEGGGCEDLAGVDDKEGTVILDGVKTLGLETFKLLGSGGEGDRSPDITGESLASGSASTSLASMLRSSSGPY